MDSTSYKKNLMHETLHATSAELCGRREGGDTVVIPLILVALSS